MIVGNILEVTDMANEKKDVIITIGRQFGSGGREIGKKLSKKLNIPYYDKEILAEAAKTSGYSEALFEKHDEKPSSSFLYALAMGVNSMGQTFQKPLLLEMYLAQFDAIKKLASEGSGIFIGRCSDYVLSENENVFNVFISANMDTRIRRVCEMNPLSEKEAEALCLKGDKDRASYYNYYSDKKWGDVTHYDLCINTSKIPIDKAVDMIINCLD